MWADLKKWKTYSNPEFRNELKLRTECDLSEKKKYIYKKACNLNSYRTIDLDFRLVGRVTYVDIFDVALKSNTRC